MRGCLKHLRTGTLCRRDCECLDATRVDAVLNNGGDVVKEQYLLGVGNAENGLDMILMCRRLNRFWDAPPYSSLFGSSVRWGLGL